MIIDIKITTQNKSEEKLFKKITKTINDEANIIQMLNANKMARAILGIVQLLRTKTKYPSDSITSETLDETHNIKDTIHEILEENRIDINELYN